MEAFGELRTCHAETIDFFDGLWSEWEQISAAAAHGIACQASTNAPAPVAAPNPEWDKEIAALREEHAALQQERLVLETELENVRGRAAELTELLSEQRRAAAQQQTQFAEELRRMRSMLEAICGNMSEDGRESPHRPPPEPPRVANTSSADPVLGSVLAQFELIQQDRMRRKQAAS